MYIIIYSKYSKIKCKYIQNCYILTKKKVSEFIEVFCPLKYTLSFIKSKWVILIIRELAFGTCRFNELEKRIAGISQKVLTANLKFLEENNLIERKLYPIVPPKVEYLLTDLGKSLQPILNQLTEWGIKNGKK